MFMFMHTNVHNNTSQTSFPTDLFLALHTHISHIFLTQYARWNFSQILWINPTSSSDKEPAERVWEGEANLGRCFSKLSCAKMSLTSKQTNQICYCTISAVHHLVMAGRCASRYLELFFFSCEKRHPFMIKQPL